MDLERSLDESGYTKAAADLELAKKYRDLIKAGIPARKPENMSGLPSEPAALDAWIENAGRLLNKEYAAAVKHVDASNDLDLLMLDVMERAELVLEYVEKDLPDHPNTAKIRKLVEAMRANERYVPEDDDE